MSLYRCFLGLFALLLAACDSVAPGAGPAGDVLFSEQFILGQTGNWHTEADLVGRTAVVNEQLIIEIHAANVMQFSTLQEPLFDDFVLEVDATPLSGHPESTYGVLFRMQDPEQFYRFEITMNGLYIVERRNADGTWTRLVPDWTQSPAILEGTNVTNRLKVAAVGTGFAFYVNDQLLVQMQDGRYLRGNIGLDAGTFGQPGLQVAFDNLVVRKP